MERDIYLHIMKKSWSWHWECKMQWGEQCWCFVWVECCLFWLWTGTEVLGKCSCPWWNLLTLQSQAGASIYHRLDLHFFGNCSSGLLGLGCVRAAPREGVWVPPVLKNTSACPGLGRGRRQHSAGVTDWDADWRVQKDRKMRNVSQSCLNYGCTHKPVFDCSPFRNGRPFSFLMSDFLVLTLYICMDIHTCTQKYALAHKYN